jgi:manganese/zinc/iron transport system permease protein
VLLTVIQSMSSGRQAGLEGFLLGSTAGMLRQDAIVILAGGRAGAWADLGLRRPMTLVPSTPSLRRRKDTTSRGST